MSGGVEVIVSGVKKLWHGHGNKHTHFGLGFAFGV